MRLSAFITMLSLSLASLVNAVPVQIAYGEQRVARDLLLESRTHGSVWFSKPEKYGKGNGESRIAAHQAGIIRPKAIIDPGRQVFREKAEPIGFKKAK
ncbi:hypothetical protein C8J56DRAFT_1061137 [Mycena floridula]|nr:hypothetical protein C8J56DRAFT_1061137 [Mycena floridula]